MFNPEWEEWFNAIRLRAAELKGNTPRLKRFLDHVRHLGSWEQDAIDYIERPSEFPEVIDVAYAVCHPDCGNEEFIVDGSTQECQKCGRLMFRVNSSKYSKLHFK